MEKPPVAEAEKSARTGEPPPPPVPRPHCANCDAPLQGDYCSRCGQRNTQIAVSLRELARDFAEEYLSLDSRLYRSILYLFFRPGFLTRQYVIGRRERYVRPVRLYLVSSLLFFFVFSLVFRPGLDFEAGRDTPVRELLEGTRSDAGGEPAEPAGQRADTTAAGAPWTLPILSEVPTISIGGWRLSLQDRMERLGGMTPRDLSERLVDGFDRHLPRMMFLLLPVFALLLKLLYVRRHWYYAEHFIFTLHFHAFAFTLFLLLLVLPDGLWDDLLPLWGAVYLFWAMYRVYRQSVWRTGAKYLLLTGTYSVLLVGAILTSVLLSLLVV